MKRNEIVHYGDWKNVIEIKGKYFGLVPRVNVAKSAVLKFNNFNNKGVIRITNLLYLRFDVKILK